MGSKVIAVDVGGTFIDVVSIDLLAIELYPIRADGSIGARRSWRPVHPANVVDSSHQ